MPEIEKKAAWVEKIEHPVVFTITMTDSEAREIVAVLQRHRNAYGLDGPPFEFYTLLANRNNT